MDNSCFLQRKKLYRMAKQPSRKDRQELFAQANLFFVDTAKLVFAGVVLACILKQDVDFGGL